ncbi:MAG TPA: ribonuclease H-like domain-containing protein [Armatimonadota bacterium]|nr:ribonuclease H-like domain-containing protein [Armatimonadota bacterium]
MLTSTFIHVQGVGYTTERRIWEMGAQTWEQFLEMHPSLPLTDAKKALIIPRVEESIASLSARDHAFFAQTIPSKEHWRAVSEFGGELAYLDIETTGCYRHDEITVIGLYDGIEMRTFIRGKNLDEFPDAVSNYKMLATFFGSGFDIPFIRRMFPNLKLDQLHVDLCHLLRRLGLTGGLKSIEGKLGIVRRPECEGLDGWDAVRLWREYRRGSDEALKLLLLYNEEDVINMKGLLEYGYDRLLRETRGRGESLITPFMV